MSQERVSRIIYQKKKEKKKKKKRKSKQICYIINWKWNVSGTWIQNYIFLIELKTKI